MDAPKGRYRVVEKDGRLIVIDNQTGSPLPTSVPPPLPTARPGRRGGARSAPSSPVAPAGPGAIDRAGDFLVALVAREWDGEGRARIAWQPDKEKGQGGWHALLDEEQQKRLGRALLALGAAPVFMLFMMFADGVAFALGAVLTVPPILWGAVSLALLHHKTNDPSLRD